MVAYRAPFSTKHRLPPLELVLPTGTWDWDSLYVKVDSVFPQAMDQTSVPPASAFNLTGDPNLDLTAENFFWDSPTECRIQFECLTSPSGTMLLSYTAAAPALKALDGREYLSWDDLSIPAS